MSEQRAFLLLCLGMVLLIGAAVEVLLALGVRGVGISLGLIVPMVLAGFGIGWMVVHYGEQSRER